MGHLGRQPSCEAYSSRKITVKHSDGRRCVDGCTAGLYSFHTLTIVLAVSHVHGTLIAWRSAEMGMHSCVESWEHNRQVCLETR